MGIKTTGYSFSPGGGYTSMWVDGSGKQHVSHSTAGSSYEEVYDDSDSPLNQLRGYLNKGASNADAAVGSAQAGVSHILSGGNQIQSDLNSVRNQAGLVNQQGNAVNATANEVKGTASQMLPYASTLTGYGDALWGEGGDLWNQSQSVFGQGNALLNMDHSAGGLSGEWMKLYSYLSPDRYVSQAASDTQGAFQNAQGQAERNLARKGVSAGSGASLALQKQYAQSLATALAAAKTKARQTGIDQQMSALGSMTSAANTLLGTGNTIAQNAINAQNAAGNMQSAAAGVYKDVASLQASAGQLQASAGQLFGNAGNLYNSAAQTQNQYLGVVNNAYSNLSDAQIKAANYYNSAAQTEVNAVNGGRSGGGRSSGGSGDTWVKTDSGRDTSQGGSPWFTTWTNSKTGAQVSGDGLFNPNNG